jgi:uncharacterized phiE125 gp8 family phage protein
MEQFRAVILPAVQSPVTTDDLGAWLRLDSDELTSPILPYLLESATQTAMNYTNRSFLTQTVKVRWDGFPGYGTTTQGLDPIRRKDYYWITLPYTPLISVTAARIIDDENNIEVIPSADYQVDVEGGRINFQNFLPAYSKKEILEIEYLAGYGSENCDIPAAIKIGIMKIAAWSYEHRGDCDPASAPDAFRELNTLRVMSVL